MDIHLQTNEKMCALFLYPPTLFLLFLCFKTLKGSLIVLKCTVALVKIEVYKSHRSRANSYINATHPQKCCQLSLTCPEPSISMCFTHMAKEKLPFCLQATYITGMQLYSFDPFSAQTTRETSGHYALKTIGLIIRRNQYGLKYNLASLLHGDDG